MDYCNTKKSQCQYFTYLRKLPGGNTIANFHLSREVLNLDYLRDCIIDYPRDYLQLPHNHRKVDCYWASTYLKHVDDLTS